MYCVKRARPLLLLMYLLCMAAAIFSATSSFSVQATLKAAASGEINQQYPQRLVSLGPLNTENIYLLGAEGRLVGNTIYCVRPAAAREKVKIGTVMAVDVEKIISLQPDIVLATGLTPGSVITHLQALGLKVVQFHQPVSFAESCEQFIQLGRLLGLEKQAEDIIAEVRSEVQLITRNVDGLPGQKVLLQIGSQPLYASVNDSFTHDFIELVNGINVVGDQVHGKTDYEKVLVRNPDVIIIAIMGSQSGLAGQEKRKWQQFPVLHAVQQNRIHIVDPDITCSPSPATFAETLRLMAGFIHPEAHLKEVH